MFTKSLEVTVHTFWHFLSTFQPFLLAQFQDFTSAIGKGLHAVNKITLCVNFERVGAHHNEIKSALIHALKCLIQTYTQNLITQKPLLRNSIFLKTNYIPFRIPAHSKWATEEPFPYIYPVNCWRCNGSLWSRDSHNSLPKKNPGEKISEMQVAFSVIVFVLVELVINS